MRREATLGAAAAALLTAAAVFSTPPPTPRHNVTDVYFGTRVVDPYRWLEAGTAPAVRAWSAAQNAYARAALDRLPGRAALRAELSKYLAIEQITTPVPAGENVFFTRRRAGENQPVLMVRAASGGAERVLFDPNAASALGLVALDWWYPSWDGKLVAFGTSANGDEQSTLQVIEARTGRRLSERISRTRDASVGWLPDDSGFYYTRFGASATQTNVDRRVYLHLIGTNPDGTRDPMVFGAGLPQANWPDVAISRDGRWLLFYVETSFSSNDLFVRDRLHPGAPQIVVNHGGKSSWAGEVVGDKIYLFTNDGAPRNRILAANLISPARGGWRTVIPQSSGVLQGASYAGGYLIANYLHNATGSLRIFERSGKLVREVPLPGIGAIAGVGSQETSAVFYYGFQSYNTPLVINRYDAASGRAAVWDRMHVPFDPARYSVRQVWYRSKDGTPISMFLMYRKGLALDGRAPTYLTGYGGFDLSITPYFSYTALMWAERGGVFAEPNLRGGGEYGEAWHRAGMLGNKQNVFDDFAWAAKWLIANNYTSRAQLAISGGSNGGLLVAAAEVQHPDLFRAVECDVPLTDMLRYQRFLIARIWVPEYGSSAARTQFAYLLKYSPYQNVRPGLSYPATLITTAEDDSRVDPMNARKFAARLQAANAGPNPILLRIEPKAGHGAGTPVGKVISERVDALAFLFAELGVKP